MTFTLEMPDDAFRRFAAAAHQRGLSVEIALVEAVERWTGAPADAPHLSFVGVGEGRPDLAESHAALLRHHLAHP